jgi:hypothetical protein
MNLCANIVHVLRSSVRGCAEMSVVSCVCIYRDASIETYMHVCMCVCVFFLCVRAFKLCIYMHIHTNSINTHTHIHEKLIEHHTPQICIEPYRTAFIGKDMQPDITIINKVVQLVPDEVFSKLGPNDVLYIDSSHVSQPMGDTILELAFILPRLNKGVLVHVHDIFLPYNYPEEWLYTRVFTEQFMLALFLHKNDEWEILWSNWYMGKKHPELFKAEGFDGFGYQASLWLRKKN